MTPTTTVPVKIKPDAAQHVAALGMQTEFEQMLEYMRNHVPDLVGIAVSLHEPYDTGDEDVVVIDAIRTEESFSPDNEKVFWDLTRWSVDAFPADVLRPFHLDDFTRDDGWPVEGFSTWPGRWCWKRRRISGAPRPSMRTMP